MSGELREKMRRIIHEPFIKELDEEEFYELKGLMEMSPARDQKFFTFHRLTIQWNVAGIEAIETELLTWFRNI